MKTLIQHIAESKALHQNVNITESKALHQNVNIAESKALHQNVNIAEKLIVNKNYNVGDYSDYNAEFYNTFKKDFGEMTNNMWFTQYKHVTDITSPNISPTQQVQIYDDFEDVVGHKKGFHVWNATFRRHNTDRKLHMWLNMMKWIFEHENEMTFKISEDFDNDCHFIREFETDEWIICFVGPERVTNMSENGNLFFAWK